MFCRIFSSAHTNSVRIRRNSTSSERRPSACLASPLSLQPGLTRSPSLWSKLSSAGQFLYREETRATRVTLVVVTMVGLTWAPEAGLRIIIGVMGQGQVISGVVTIITPVIMFQRPLSGWLG